MGQRTLARSPQSKIELKWDAARTKILGAAQKYYALPNALEPENDNILCLQTESHSLQIDRQMREGSQQTLNNWLE